MAILDVKRGTATGINNEPVSDGTLLINKETGQAYFDIGNGAEGSRKEIGAIHDNLSVKGTADIKGAVVTDLNADNATCENLTVNESMTINAPYVTAHRIEGTSVNLPSEDSFLVEEKSFKSLLLDAVYPIGSLYWTKDKNFNPNISFGGFWVRVKNAFIYAAGDEDEVNDTLKGSDSHSHDKGNLAARIGSARSQAQTLTFNWDNTWVEKEYNEGLTGIYTIRSDNGSYGQNESFSHYTSIVGNTGEASNMPPYLSRYCWERINNPVEDWE